MRLIDYNKLPRNSTLYYIANRCGWLNEKPIEPTVLDRWPWYGKVALVVATAYLSVKITLLFL